MLTPLKLKEKLSLDRKTQEFINKSRQTVFDILKWKDDRKMIVLGPCSIHNFQEAIDYANKIKKLQKKYEDKFFMIMRTYLEKPRTSIGWKWYMYDPYIDWIWNLEDWIYLSRKLLLQINQLWLPIATEFLSNILAKYIQDLVSYGTIWARTTESQIHREFVSNLNIPVGFKNNTFGDIDIPINSIISASSSHHFLDFDDNLNGKLINSKWNNKTNVILRWGKLWPNYDKKTLDEMNYKLQSANIDRKIIVDVSHWNSNKIANKQIDIITYLSNYYEDIAGIMIESYLRYWNQKISNNLDYWISITDSCIDIKQTDAILEHFYKAINYAEV